MSYLKPLLKDPEKYRAANNFKATNIVFPVEYRGNLLVVKKPRALSSLINSYYVLQDRFFCATRRLSSAKQRFSREVEKLEMLDGRSVPRLVAHDEETIIREYLIGEEFRNMDSDERKKGALDGALEAMQEIHNLDVIIGDAHVKNVFVGNEGFYWMDLEGVFDESDLVRSKAADLLKFVYSTYSVTKDKEATLYAAEIVAQYPDTEVKVVAKGIASCNLNSTLLWFPTRLPLGGKLHKEIRDVLVKA